MNKPVTMEGFAQYVNNRPGLNMDETLNIIDMFIRATSECFIKGSLDGQDRAAERLSGYTIEEVPRV